MPEVLLSVVIPCYNQGIYLQDALQSVEQCRGLVPEIIVINDGSTEQATLEALKHVPGKCRILHQANLGLSAARNNGIRAAAGRYILPLDADNKIRPDFPEKAVSVLEKNSKTGVVYGDPFIFGERQSMNRVAPFDVTKILAANYIDACAIYRKQVWEECGGYDEEMRGFEDWDFWLMAYEKGWLFEYLPGIAFDYRTHSDSMLANINPQMRGRLRGYIYQKHQQLVQSQLNLCHQKITDTGRVSAVFKAMRTVKSFLKLK